MAKRYEMSVEEIIKNVLSPKWTKAGCLAEIQKRAKEGCSQINSHNCAVNDLWNLFKACPEVFLFSEYISEITKDYMDYHTYKLGNHATQEFNMQNTLSKMAQTAKAIYGDVEKQIQELQKQIKTQSQQKSSETGNQFENEFDDKLHIFDDEEENMGKKEKNLKAISLTKAQKQTFINDTTSIEKFLPANADRLEKFFKKKNVYTVGEFMSLLLDKKGANNFACFGKNNREIYEKFNANVAQYITGGKKVGESQEKSVENKQTPSQEEVTANTEITEKSFQQLHDEFFAKLDSLPAKNFIKGCQEIEEIYTLCENYIRKIVPILQQDVATAQDLNDQVDFEKLCYIDLIDRKRKIVEKEKIEREKESVSEKILSTVKQDVRYHHNPQQNMPERHSHSHNPFNEREL